MFLLAEIINFVPVLLFILPSRRNNNLWMDYSGLRFYSKLSFQNNKMCISNVLDFIPLQECSKHVTHLLHLVAKFDKHTINMVFFVMVKTSNFGVMLYGDNGS